MALKFDSSQLFLAVTDFTYTILIISLKFEVYKIILLNNNIYVLLNHQAWVSLWYTSNNGFAQFTKKIFWIVCA